MAYKLIDAAQARWRAVNAPHLVAPSVPARYTTKANCSNAFGSAASTLACL
jgi:hypothetical protein